jgi:hypothetical protein
MFGAIIGTVARLPRIVKAAGTVYGTGVVVSAVRSAVNGDGIGEIAGRAAKSWFGVPRKSSSKKKKKSIPKKKRAAVKRAADKLRTHPTAANVKAAVKTAAEAGIVLPQKIVEAAKQM